MKTTLLLVGKTTSKPLGQLIDDYVGRLKHYLSFDIEVVPELKNARSLDFEQQKQKEGIDILNRIKPSDFVVLLDERGTQFRSVDFAHYIEKQQHRSCGRVVYIIGGPYGFSDAVYSRADDKISLSSMTFSHQMIRLFFVEQLYRAHTIINNQPYHHE
ncbi:MAG: 23S rRNA (pseudouridine(1915)-N(3))-methyltransferase RlmH [Bacteroidaceae bacterium]|nr:23S rRNA (pseudouridine(1915)-N(3))-methyltransferase RlmH [Bacteroidaceae bacterium]